MTTDKKNTYNCTQEDVLHRVISMAKLYNFDDMTMMDNYCLLSIKGSIKKQHTMPMS